MCISFYYVRHKLYFIKKHGLVFSLLLLIPFLLRGQNISIQVLDKDQNSPLIGATAMNEQTGKGAASDEDGVILIARGNDEDLISFSYLGYKTTSYLIKDLPDAVYLKSVSSLLNEITVYAKTSPIPLTKNTETIKDFVVEGNKILMLSKYDGGKFILKLTDLDARVINTLKIKPKIQFVEAFYTSCTGSHFLIGSEEVLQIFILDDEIKIIDRADRKLFDKLVQPCLSENENYFYFEKTKIKNQIASIYAIDKKNKEAILFAGVTDDDNLKRYPYEKAYMDYADGTGPLYLGIHAEDARDAVQWGDMLNVIFYVPVDYHLISHEDKMLLFDHEKNHLHIFDQLGNVLEKHPIEYPKQKGWKSRNNMYSDLATGELYAVHKIGVNKYFTLIDLENGATKKRYVLKEPFMENMAIQNGVVYFTNSTAVDGARILKKLSLDTMY